LTKTNRFIDEIFLSGICDDIYKDVNPLVMMSVFIDGIILLVYTDRITEGLFRMLKIKYVNDVEVFAGDFTNKITEGSKPGFSYSDVTLSLAESPRESSMKIFHR